MQHFTDQTLKFLTELSDNNNRDWFQEQKPRYETQVREPSLAFITAMQPLLAEVSKHFIVSAKKTGGSLMRVYRDTRFSKDKTPYKTNIGIHFRHEAGKDIHAPGYYVHIGLEEIFVGAGIWRPDNSALNKIRDAIVEDPPSWEKHTQKPPFSELFQLKGDSLKRPPRGYDPEHQCLTDLKRKDFIASHHLGHDAILQDDFAEQVCELYSVASPFMNFLCNALEIDF